MAPEPLDISEHELLFKATNLSKLASIDLLQDRSRVEIFAEYCAKKREPVCGQFLNLLNGSDGFIVNMSARIIAKIACWNPSAN
nr:PREDICTED: V-type proton ATPase subunit H-like [Bemisia tabaci]XP_018899936.1 PREDICTED: V-type proton ATPase subunit H-like [Bemisia tabaci]XP_018899937.1 PREDICTED: V-type proton ATPase subunit H-like [Bemisia tabaci]